MSVGRLSAGQQLLYPGDHLHGRQSLPALVEQRTYLAVRLLAFPRCLADPSLSSQALAILAADGG